MKIIKLNAIELKQADFHPEAKYLADLIKEQF